MLTIVLTYNKYSIKIAIIICNVIMHSVIRISILIAQLYPNLEEILFFLVSRSLFMKEWYLTKESKFFFLFFS